ncbi:O-antigen/teichoic acid export membrane protein [Halorubrum trapanicum]|uniref:O-antigen/teichoic acid export membrane protein n=1 Tax=Halorubrum trapanicum TaxID=29284 RepID=A0A8J7RP82_9EURY|nr:lipopolysaccharide biosynthesis protein [Halorubrum trapanicum]MBP1900762.1 O-antigen/teichoic acid export membrane protein [Halorubrum trapanicum]
MAENTADLDLGSEALSSVAAKFTMSGLGFVGVVLFARVLGPAGTGRYYFALAIALLLVRVDAGVGVALKKRVSEAGADPRPYLAVGIAFHLAWVVVVATATFAVAYYTSFLPMTPLVVTAVVAVLATVGLFQILNRFYAGLGYPSRSLWADTVRSVLTLGFQLPLLFAGYEAFGLLAGLAGGTLITALGVFAAAGVRPRLKGFGDTSEDLFVFARYSVPTAVVEDFYKRVDVILIGFFAGDAAVGFYETALRIVTPAQQLSGSISNALGVKVSGLTSLGQEIREDVVNTVAYSGLLVLPMFFGALAMPAALMRTFFGSSFGAGGAALVGVAGFFIFYIYQDPFATALESSDRPQFVFRLRTAALIIHLPLAGVLGYYWDGLLGIIAATLFVEVVVLFSYQYLSKRELGGIILPWPLWAQFGSAVLMYITIIAVRPLIALSWWLPVVGLIGFGAAVYFGTLAVLSPHFRLTLGNVLLPALRRIKERIA